MFVTSSWPLRSRIWPRGASIRTERIWLSSAARRYCGPESTCSAQSRKKRTPNASSATAARIPIRSASCGVKRYGDSTRGSGGRKRPERLRPARAPVRAKGSHPVHSCLGCADGEQPPHERVHRQGQQQVEEHLGGERVEQHRPCRDVVRSEEHTSELQSRVDISYAVFCLKKKT